VCVCVCVWAGVNLEACPRREEGNQQEGEAQSSSQLSTLTFFFRRKRVELLAGDSMLSLSA
jgi:hypothetical protein